MGDLSKNFSLWEFEKSAKARELGIDNRVKDAVVKNNLQNLCLNIMQPIRDHYGCPVKPTSGYRCPPLNRAVGGSMNPPSQHMRGEAVDLYVEGHSLTEVMHWIVFESGLDYDQVILEYNSRGEIKWIHISYTTRRANRRQALVRVYWQGYPPYVPYSHWLERQG